MIEVPIVLQLIKGLTPWEEIRAGLRTSVNVRPKENELVAIKQLTEYWSAESGTTWPWPQLFRLEDQLFMCYRDEIYMYRVEGWELMLSGITEQDYPWGAAVIGKFPVFVNNKTVVHPTEVTILQSRQEDRPFVELAEQAGSFPVSRDVCNFNGQFIVAAPWMYGKWHPFHVAWAKPGQIDFTLGLNSAAGYRFIQGAGYVMRVVATESGFIAYGNEGVARFVAAEHPIGFAHQLISEVGLKTQLAVAPYIGGQVYVGTDNVLYQVSDRGVSQVGYDYFFSEATGEISLHYDDEEQLLYASF